MHSEMAAQAGRAGGKMNADRTVLTDAMWVRIEPMLPGKATDPGITTPGTHLVDGVIAAT